MVTDIGQDHLDDGNRATESAARAPGSAASRYPNFARAARQSFRERQGNAQAAARRSTRGLKLRPVDGELIELGSRRSGAKPSIEDKATFFGELKGPCDTAGLQ